MFLSTTCFGASQWDVTAPAGTSYASDLDTNIITNFEAQDRLLIGYRKGCEVIPSTVATLSVGAGELALPNSGGTVTRYRRNTTATAVTWSNIDTGAEAASTTYYVWGIADTDATTFTVKISTSGTAPTSSTYYALLGTFYNDASSNITNVDNYRNDKNAVYRDTIKGWINFNATGTAAINDSFNVSSITDNGTGDFTISWTTSFGSTYYSVVGTASAEGGDNHIVSLYQTSPLTASSARIIVTDDADDEEDTTVVCVMAIGER